jgi:class 3 adenylate cyclase
MSFIARLQRARELLEQQGRLSTRALERELQIGSDELEELIEELVDVQQVARREGRILVWTAASRAVRDGGQSAVGGPQPSAPRTANGRTASSSTRPDEAVARKVVTIVFADLVGSTALHERLDAESARRLMDRYYRALHAAVEAHGGTVVKLLGDGVMAAFGVPRVGEDDAIRAVRAAVSMQQACRELVHVLTSGASPNVGAGNEAIPPFPTCERKNGGEGAVSLRVAVNSGEVVVSADNTDIVGDPVNVAARLQQEARDGDVLIGESTRRLVGELVALVPAGVFALKGRSESVAAYRVVSLERPAGAAATPFVGRDDELRRITAVYDADAFIGGVIPQRDFEPNTCLTTPSRVENGKQMHCHACVEPHSDGSRLLQPVPRRCLGQARRRRAGEEVLNPPW